MSLNPEIKKVLVLGPVNSLYNNRAEYAVSCYEACKAMKSEGLKVVLMFANENFQLAQEEIADVIYSEPYCLESLEKILKKENPDIILPVFGGKKALSLMQEAGEKGLLNEMQVTLPCMSWENIKNIIDHQLFKDTLLKINEPGIPSKRVGSANEAVTYAESSVGYPAFVKPVIENGKSEGVIVHTREELLEGAEEKLKESTCAQIVVEKSISGWKQIQFTIMRDRDGVTATVCSMESLEPVENQNHKTVIISPATSISTLEQAMLENSAKRIINSLDLCGVCNLTFALKPNSKEYVLLEVNPTVNKISTFSAKTADYPVAKNSTLLACGYTIPELNVQNENGSYSVYGSRQVSVELNIGTPVMAVGATFEEALMKTCQTVVCNNLGLRNKDLEFESNEEIRARVSEPSDLRLFAVYEAIRRNILTHEEIYRSVGIAWCYLDCLQNIANLEKKLEDVHKGVTLLSFDLYESAKIMGFSDDVIQFITGTSVPGANGIVTMAESSRLLTESRKLAHLACGYNYIAKRENPKSNIFHSLYQGQMINPVETNVTKGTEQNQTKGTEQNEIEAGEKNRVLFISGKSDSYEYDANALKAMAFFKQKNYEVAVISNCVYSLVTNSGYADRVYLECPNAENIMNVVLKEKPEAVYLTFAGEEALELSSFLEQQALKLPGTNTAGKKIAENLGNLPQNCQVQTYASVDVLTDTKNILIPAIIEQLPFGQKQDQRISAYPLWTISDVIRDKIIKQAFAIAQKINLKGVFNIEFAISNNTLYVKKVSPFASKQLPFVCAVTKMPVVELCCELLNGASLASLGYGAGVYKLPACNFVRASFASGAVNGEFVTYTGSGNSRKSALYKALLGADYSVEKQGSVYFGLSEQQLFDLPGLAKDFIQLGYKLYGKKTNVKLIKDFGMEAVYAENPCGMPEPPVFVIGEENLTKGTEQNQQTPGFSNVELVKELLAAIKADYSVENLELIDYAQILGSKRSISFTKMASIGNDFIVIDGDETEVSNIQDLAIELCKRTVSIGAQYLIVITKKSEDVPFVRLYDACGKECICANEALGVAARYCYEKNKKTEGSNFQLETSSGIKNLILYKKNNVVTSVCQKIETVTPDCENKQVFAGGMNLNGTFVKMENGHCVVNSNFPDKIDIEKYGRMLEEELDDYMETAYEGKKKEWLLQFISFASDANVHMRCYNRDRGELQSSVEASCAAVVAGVINGWCKKDQDIFVTSKGGKLTVRYTNDTLYVTGEVQSVYTGQILI